MSYRIFSSTPAHRRKKKKKELAASGFKKRQYWQQIHEAVTKYVRALTFIKAAKTAPPLAKEKFLRDFR